MNWSNQNNRSGQSNQNTQSNQNFQITPTTFLPQHGHYRHLRVYRVTKIIYDITFYFTQHYLGHGDRTVDQMVQAARSGKQNIAEGNLTYTRKNFCLSKFLSRLISSNCIG